MVYSLKNNLVLKCLFLCITTLLTALSLSGCASATIDDSSTEPQVTPTCVCVCDCDGPTLEPNAQNTPVSIQSSPIQESAIAWKAGFENGDISEIEEVGNFINQGSGRYNLVTPHAHSGSYSAALTIDTKAPGYEGSHAAYLFHYRSQFLPEDAYYYSAWYFIPENVTTDVYWNIMQWKSTRGGNPSEPMYVINVGNRGDGEELYLYLSFLPNKGDLRQTFSQDLANVPVGQWFQIEAYYRRAQDNTGQITVWQDGIEIINVTNTPTVLSDNTIHWSVNNYTSGIEPNPLTLYVDDMVISTTQIGPNPIQ
jgi:hypothetical protein